MKKYILSFILTTSGYAQELINLQENVQDFVLETKRISIPSYPDAFNPSIVRWKDRLLLSFRTRGTTTKAHFVGFIWLDEQFEPISNPQLLQSNNANTICQDPRLLVINDRLYMAYNDLVTFDEIQTRRMFFSEVLYENNRFYLHEPQPLPGPWDPDPETTEFNAFIKHRQKNWVPFTYNNEVLLSYTLEPHQIVSLNNNTTFAIRFASENSSCWSLGELRGGTQAIKLDNCYLGIFHSCKILATQNSNGKKMRHYFMGAYTFKPEPPFEITHISPRPIVGNGFYDGCMDYPTWTDLRVVFPTGCIDDEKHVWVTYGRQDFESWVMKLDKKLLLESLIPCNKPNIFAEPLEIKKLPRRPNNAHRHKKQQIARKRSLGRVQKVALKL